QDIRPVTGAARIRMFGSAHPAAWPAAVARRRYLPPSFVPNISALRAGLVEEEPAAVAVRKKLPAHAAWMLRARDSQDGDRFGEPDSESRPPFATEFDSSRRKHAGFGHHRGWRRGELTLGHGR